MIGSFRGLAAKVGLVLALSYPQISVAEEFTGKAFLAWDAVAQDNYVEVSLVMASTVSTRIRPDHAACISDAFFDDTGAHDAGKTKIRDAIAAYPTYHPSSVIVVLIEQACGAFN